ncbi:TPA: tol-pal system YbgF family protein [Pseudomonas aeruginosa]|uniref:tetratricopeptide repeat protein n=1 Tax=Pseudomonas aeruginosa TaxID=287 RepID=UPI000F844072|nr:hypothetical protein [Pseudomonas aeruginosa]MEA8474304.1 hypothetical protein [Pseudomonas aeruginosa]RTU66341.1 hypothetical protein DY977_19965 [Pseudomonas aeruginosa]HCL4061325.1 hypothetical protein [Pseudomonas aeruginosa]
MPMRSLIVACLALSATGCNSWSLNSDLNGAYRAYDKGDCAQVMLDLSRAERRLRARPYLQPEISLLRGQCLERQSLFVDAAQTYHFIIARYPTSEYAYRAKARLETLRQLGRLNETPASASAVPTRL